MKIHLIERDERRRMLAAYVHDENYGPFRGRRFRWSRRTGDVEQWIWHPVSNANGYGNGYWRRTGIRLANRVIELIRIKAQDEENSKPSTARPTEG